MFKHWEIIQAFEDDRTRVTKHKVKSRHKPSPAWKGLPKPRPGNMPKVLDVVDAGMLGRLGQDQERFKRQQQRQMEQRRKEWREMVLELARFEAGG